MITEQSQLHGDLSDSHALVRDAGRLEERQRVQVELVLALGTRGKDNSWVRDALLEVKHFIDNPRSKEEQDRLLLASIMSVALPK